MKFSDFF